MEERREDLLITGINVTPLVDIVLVLLMIFMATAPMLSRRSLPLQVPRAATSERKATDTLQLTLTPEGQLLLAKEPIPLGELVPELTRRLRFDPTLHVSIAADRLLPYGQVVTVMDLVRSAGVKRVGLDVRSQKAGAEPDFVPATPSKGG